MAALEQSEIDKLQMAMESLGRLKEIAYRARERVKVMYFDLLKVPCLLELTTMEEINEAISLMDSKITTQSKYYESFLRLKHSYQERIRTR